MTRNSNSMVVGALAFTCLASFASGVERATDLTETLKGLGAIHVERKEAFGERLAIPPCLLAIGA